VFNFFNRFKREEKRYTETEIANILAGQPIATRIGKKEALNIPAVGTAVTFIAGTVAGLPIRLYKRDGDMIEEILDDYRLKLLNDETGDLLDAEQFKRLL
jgi:phage portal protein BeeE